jgi:hypothetical protein
MTEQPEDPEAHLVPCAVCREPVRNGAKKCIHCSSVLDWHRWLGVSETTLALLVALVSVIGATAPRVLELFTPDRSRLTLTYRQVHQNFVELEAWNQGNKNAQLLSAKLSATTRDKKQWDTDLDINGSPAVGAGQQILFGFTVHPARVTDFLGWPHKDVGSAAVVARVQEFNKSAEDRTIVMPLAQFQLFCMGTEGAAYQNARVPLTPEQLATKHCL